ncbi:unnamed protein product [Didymodactylos carnosus]|uniref:GTP-binding protein Rhes n=1 Tax=Didymodactylos carnosus TaxID=1234261 RepID=A0A815CQT9_9BILA|nr:unnamed protein product [Didymodactylos carnosus]CAF1290973.1 unnamed protein product [Didymodactylos carnosus]CAF3556996.1 unnamed protein product [Didymodactylos carnosus]CAF4096804.1 unnamed protein product [Didymodactylos carnosus]
MNFDLLSVTSKTKLMADTDQRYRLVVMGASRTGKSSIIRMFLNGKCPETYRETVEDLYYREYTVEDKTIKVDILDTAGNMEFPAMRRLSIATSHAFILVYSVDNLSSFEEIRHIIEQIKEQRSTNYQEIPIVVVGNKTDRTDKRQIEEEQVRDMLQELGPLHCRFAECSALDRPSIIDIFLKLLSLVQLSAARTLSPILRRKVSERLKKKEFTENEKGINRSRSLIRRTSVKKKTQTEKLSETPNDCLIS